MSDISFAEAKRLAEECLADVDDGSMQIDDRQTVEHDFGWLFVAETDTYLQSGDPKDRVPGVGPIVVARDNGEAAFVPTFRPPEMGIQAFAAKWRRRQGD